MSLSIFAGHKPRAEEIRALFPLSVIKSTDEDRISATALTADEELLLPVVAGASYFWIAWLMYEGNTNGSGDLSLEFAGPGDIAYGSIGNNLSNVVRVDGARTSGSWQFATTGTGNLLSAYFLGTLITSDDGDLALSWGQNSSNAVGTTIHAGSVLAAIKSTP